MHPLHQRGTGICRFHGARYPLSTSRPAWRASLLWREYRPHQQPARRCNPNILPDIKAEITKLIEAKFIRQCRYAEWISNVVPVYKKNGKLRVCIDFRNLNKATPMDGYPMPVADLLVDAAAGHQVISFMDGNAGYNQIFMAEEDIPKTAFRCPGHVGLFE